jgi:hypothetical protein
MKSKVYSKVLLIGMVISSGTAMAGKSMESDRIVSIISLAHKAPIVLAQVATSATGGTPQPDYILNDCQETASTSDPSSAVRAVDPAYMLKNYLYSSTNGKIIADLATIKTTLLQGTVHGKITSVIDNTGRSWYHYDPPSNYVGNDKAVFLAQFEGKAYKIVLELHVFEGPATPGDFGQSTCTTPKLIKVNQPSSGFNSYNINSITVNFANLARTKAN